MTIFGVLFRTIMLMARQPPTDAVMRSSEKRNRTSGQKKILRAPHPKDCTLFHLVLWRFIGYLAYRFPKRHQAGLLTHGSSYSPSLPISFLASQWLDRISSPFTAAGPFPICTGFPIKLLRT